MSGRIASFLSALGSLGANGPRSEDGTGQGFDGGPLGTAAPTLFVFERVCLAA